MCITSTGPRKTDLVVAVAVAAVAVQGLHKARVMLVSGVLGECSLCGSVVGSALRVSCVRCVSLVCYGLSHYY